MIETVEYNSAKDLLIVKNSLKSEVEEQEMLAHSGWTPMPLEQAAEVLPLTPSVLKEEKGSWLNLHLRRTSSDSTNSDAESAKSTECPPNKRVYKRAPVASSLHMPDAFPKTSDL